MSLSMYTSIAYPTQVDERAADHEDPGKEKRGERGDNKVGVKGPALVRSHFSQPDVAVPRPGGRGSGKRLRMRRESVS